MAVKYMDADFAVFHGIFRGLRIRDLRTGNVIDPNLELKALTLRTWSALPKVKFSNRRARQIAEQGLFRDCGRLALDPSDSRAYHFGYMSVDMLVEHYWREGEMRSIAEGF